VRIEELPDLKILEKQKSEDTLQAQEMVEA